MFRLLRARGKVATLLYVTERVIQSSGQDFAEPDNKLFASIILARPLPDDSTVTTLKDLFPGATEIAFPRQVLGARYVCYPSPHHHRRYLLLYHFRSIFNRLC